MFSFIHLVQINTKICYISRKILTFAVSNPLTMYCKCVDNSKFPDIFDIGKIYLFFWPVDKEWIQANVFPKKKGVQSIIAMSGLDFVTSFVILKTSVSDDEIEDDLRFFGFSELCGDYDPKQNRSSRVDPTPYVGGDCSGGDGGGC